MTEHFAYVIAKTREDAYSIFRHWVSATPNERRSYENWNVVFKGEADARYLLARHLAESERDQHPQIWKIDLSATVLTVAPSKTGLPPYAEGDIITVHDREYGITYRAEVAEVLLAGASRPWIVGFESLKPIEPNDSRHYVGSLEADDDGTSPNIVKDEP